MANVTVTIDRVAGLAPAGNPKLVDITNFPSGPWLVEGTVGTTVTLTGMSYTINNNPALGIPFPPANYPAPFNFLLTVADIPANGSYLLTVYAYDTDSAANDDVVEIRHSGIPGPTPPPPPPEPPQPVA